jgi:predicted SPOUT superfamily RNA methylase MTH1
MLTLKGIMNPLDTPHHVRATEYSEYREGVVIRRPTKADKGSWVNIGFKQDCQIDKKIQENTRVTIKLLEDKVDPNFKCKFHYLNAEYNGYAVSPYEPKERKGLYWGYHVRVANSFKAAFDECPFEVSIRSSILGWL